MSAKHQTSQTANLDVDPTLEEVKRRILAGELSTATDEANYDDWDEESKEQLNVAFGKMFNWQKP